jgi:IclR family KDG regulon transcriptional repressor
MSIPVRQSESLPGTPGNDSTRSASAGVHTTLRVLDLLAARAPLGLSEIARELGMPKSTVHRICNVLVQRGWAVRDQETRFDLGIRALRLAGRAEELPIVIAFRTVAAEWLAVHDETVCLAVLDGSESLFVALEETSHAVRLVTYVGSKTPAFASASGRIVLASLSNDAVAATFPHGSLVTPTGRRLNGLPELFSILAQVRESGYAEDWEESAAGLYAASVPVANDGGNTLAALTTCVPTSRITPERRDAIVADLQAAGERLSQFVGWLPSFAARRSA